MTRLTTQEIEAIRKRAEVATEGPWEFSNSSVKSEHARSIWYDGESNEVCSLSDGGEYILNMNAKADAEFIAEARNDIPKLLAEVDRLHKGELAYRRMLIRIREEVLRFGSDIDHDVFALLYERRGE